MSSDSKKIIEDHWQLICIESNQSEENCLLAFSKNKSSFKYFLDQYKNYPMCLDAVKYNDAFLEFTPQQFQTPEIIKIALKSDDSNFIYVKNQTEEMCLEMVNKNSDHFEKCLFKSDRIIKKALIKDCKNITFIDRVVRENVDMVLKKLNSGNIYQSIVDKIVPFMSKNELLNLVKKVPEAILYLDQDIDLCLKVLEYHPEFYNDIKIVSEVTSAEDCIAKLKAKKKLCELVLN